MTELLNGFPKNQERFKTWCRKNRGRVIETTEGDYIFKWNCGLETLDHNAPLDAAQTASKMMGVKKYKDRSFVFKLPF